MLTFTKRILGCLALVSLAGTANAAESIAYRLPETKEMHFDDARKAEQHLAAVRKLGCEARLDSHGGHTDVIYRSTRWHSMEVVTDELAHQWEDWMKKAGFETLHGHAAVHGDGHDDHAGHDHAGHDHAGHDHAGHSHAGHDHGPGEVEEVSYRMDRWKNLHIEDARQAPEIIAVMKGLGCEVRSENHAGHADVSVRCPQWKLIELASHKAAQGWEGWLQKQGFVVKYDH